MGTVIDIGKKKEIKANDHIALSDEVLERLCSVILHVTICGSALLAVDDETSDFYCFVKRGHPDSLFKKDEDGFYVTSETTATSLDWEKVFSLGKVNVQTTEDILNFLNGGNNE